MSLENLVDKPESDENVLTADAAHAIAIALVEAGGVQKLFDSQAGFEPEHIKQVSNEMTDSANLITKLVSGKYVLSSVKDEEGNTTVTYFDPATQADVEAKVAELAPDALLDVHWGIETLKYFTGTDGEKSFDEYKAIVQGV